MNHNNIPLGICIGFILLGICSFFFKISIQIVTVISISSLFFTISQTIESFLSLKNEENKYKFDLTNMINHFNIDEIWMMFVKRYAPFFSTTKMKKFLKFISNLLELLAIIILIIGFVIPIKLFNNESIGSFFTLVSFGILFLNIWLIEKFKVSNELFYEMYLFSILLNNNYVDNTCCKENENENGKDENAHT